MADVDRSYRNITLSFRGSERQAPSTLQLALRFSRIIEIKATQGLHPEDWSTEQRLSAIVQEFNDTSGLQAKHRIEEDRYKAVLNLLSGSCDESWYILVMVFFIHRWFHFCGFEFLMVREADFFMFSSQNHEA